MKVRLALCVLLVLATHCWAAATPNGLVILLTDYGTDSLYVGALKGAIYTKFPEARIDAITNAVPPFDILCGAHMLAEAAKEFPRGTTFCCVVDPGVGTERKCIVLETRNGYVFVGPDNGLLSLVAEQFGVVAVREAANRAFWRSGDASHSFHGRDIFGPVAAAIAQGKALAEVGPELEDIVKVGFKKSRVQGDTVYGEIIRTDTYGNLITNIPPGDLEKIGLRIHDRADVTIGEARFTAPWKSTYGDVPDGQKVLLVQSLGYVECAVNLGSLEREIVEGLHAEVTIRKAK